MVVVTDAPTGGVIRSHTPMETVMAQLALVVDEQPIAFMPSPAVIVALVAEHDALIAETEAHRVRRHDWMDGEPAERQAMLRQWEARRTELSAMLDDWCARVVVAFGG